MPKLGESITEATILKWYKKAGDTVQQEETVLDIATDKVDTEVPSTYSGVITEVLFNVNDIVPIGAVLARIEIDIPQMIDAPIASEAAIIDLPNLTLSSNFNQEASILIESSNTEELPFIPTTQTTKQSTGNNRFFSPLVLNIANSEGISLSELEHLPGTVTDGRVSKKDILQYIADKKSGDLPNPLTLAPKPTQVYRKTPPAFDSQQPLEPSVEKSEPIAALPKQSVEIIEMDRMRKLISKHMVDSTHTSAHVTSFAEADVTNMVTWRNKIKSNFEKIEGTKITFTPMFIECLIKVIKRFPIINSSVDGDNIIIKHFCNIGMATALPNNNLIVPVIKQAENLSLVGLTRAVNTLAKEARTNKLKPEDIQGGTFTFTNVGSFGSLMGTPIINQPQVAILAVGTIKKRAVVIETDKGDYIGIRHMMYLSLSYDHRIIDGSVGASFLSELAKEFENWDVDRELKLVVKEQYID